MLLKECVYSKMIDYDSLTFQETLASYGNGNEDITSIYNLELAFKSVRHKMFTPPSPSKIWSIALYGDITDKLVNVRGNSLFLSNVKTNIKSYNSASIS